MNERERAIRVRRAVMSLGRRLRMHRADTGLSGSKLSVLGHLFRRGSLSAIDLATLERVQPQSLTRLLAELMSDRLISRRGDPNDGRRWLLEITHDGRALLAHDMSKRDDWLEQAMAVTLSETERQLLQLVAPLLERIADADDDGDVGVGVRDGGSGSGSGSGSDGVGTGGIGGTER